MNGLAEMLACYTEVLSEAEARKKRAQEKELEEIEFKLAQLYGMREIRELQHGEYIDLVEHRRRWEAEGRRHNEQIETELRDGLRLIATAISTIQR